MREEPPMDSSSGGDERAVDEVVSDFDQTNDEAGALGGDDGGDVGADPEVQEPAEGDVLDQPDEWIPMGPQQSGLAWPLAANLADDDGLGDDELTPAERGGADRDPAVTPYSEEGKP
jgi:hypothetical protein